MVATSQTDTTVSLSWTATNVTGAYDIYNGDIKVNTSDIITTSYKVTNLTPNRAYRFKVITKDSLGNILSSQSGNAIAVATKKAVLFVAGNSTLASAEIAVSQRLEDLGYWVTIKAARSTVTADATGKNLVYISSTVTSGDVNTKFM